MGESAAKFQICSSLLFWIAAVSLLVPSLILVTCNILGSALSAAFLVTVPVLVLSSVLVYKFTEGKKRKKEVTFVDNGVQEENPSSGEVSNLLGYEKVEEEMQALMENDVTENEEAAAAAAQENPVSGGVENFLGNDKVVEKIEEEMQEAVIMETVPETDGDDDDDVFENRIQSVMDVAVEENEAVFQESEVVGFVNEPDFDFLSETDTSSVGGDEEENFEPDWMCNYKNNAGGHQNKEDQMMVIFSDSVSFSSEEDDGDDDDDDDDEDGLIEISIPGRDEQQEPNYKQKLDQESITNIKQQAGLKELLAADFNEANEEENLIEIDISMGSIKCSRFEIEA